MKKGFNKKILIAIFSLFLLPIIAISFLFSHKVEASANVSMNASEVADKSYFAAGDLVDVKGTINGDAFLSGSEINFSGNVNGNLFVAGNTLNIEGTVNGMVIAAGNNIKIDSKNISTLIVAGNMVNINSAVNKNAYIAGNILSLSSDANIGQDLFISGNFATINSKINRDFDASLSTLNLNNEINRNAVISAEYANFNDSSKIYGNLKHNSDIRSSKNISSVVYGTIETFKSRNNAPHIYINQLGAKLFDKVVFGLLTTLLIGFLLIKYSNKILLKINKQNEEKFLNNFKNGLLFTLLFPILTILLFITIVGIKLSFIAILLFSLVFIMANIIAANFVGNYFFKNILKYKKYSYYLSFFVGSLIIIIVSLIPFVGWIANAIVVLSSIGGLYYISKEIAKIVNKNLK